jgi:hypothetical protein
MAPSRRFGALLAAGYGSGPTHTNAYMKIKDIICSVITVGLLAGGLTACVTEKDEKK